MITPGTVGLGCHPGDAMKNIVCRRCCRSRHRQRCSRTGKSDLHSTTMSSQPSIRSHDVRYPRALGFGGVGRYLRPRPRHVVFRRGRGHRRDRSFADRPDAWRHDVQLGRHRQHEQRHRRPDLPWRRLARRRRRAAAESVQFRLRRGRHVAFGSAPFVSIGPTIGNVGIEGVSYDPRNGNFVTAKQDNPAELRHFFVALVFDRARRPMPFPATCSLVPPRCSAC